MASDRELVEFKPNWTFRPGVSLAEVLAERHLTPGDAAALTGLPVETILGIGRGTIAIDETTAGAFHVSFGVSATFWLKHQADYEAALARGAKDTSRDYHTDYPWIASGADVQAPADEAERGDLPGDVIGIRNSRDPGGAVLRFTRDEFHAFIGGVRNGEFDGFGLQGERQDRD